MTDFKESLLSVFGGKTTWLPRKGWVSRNIFRSLAISVYFRHSLMYFRRPGMLSISAMYSSLTIFSNIDSLSPL